MANRVPVLVKDVQLLANKAGVYVPFACATNGRLTVVSQLYETTTPSSGSWRTWIPAGVSEWDIELSMVTVLRDLFSTFWFSWETILESVRKNLVQIKWRMVDKSGYEKYAIGYTWITDTSILFDMEQAFSESTVKFQGHGGLDVSSLITPNNPKQMRLEWVTTGAENGELAHASLVGLTVSKVMQVSVEGDDKYKVIDVGVPVFGRQCKLDNVAGKFLFNPPMGQLDADMFVYAIIDL